MHIKYINISMANLRKVKKREKQISIATSNEREAYNKRYVANKILPVT